MCGSRIRLAAPPSTTRTLAADACHRGAGADGTRPNATANGRSRSLRTEARCCPGSPPGRRVPSMSVSARQPAAPSRASATSGSLASRPGESGDGRDAASRTPARRSATTSGHIATSYDPEFGPMPADDIGEVEWQMWVDYLSREGLSRSRITTHVAVASAIYAWAIVPSRQLPTQNPLRLVERPPNDEKPRLRAAFAPEAEQLLEALSPKDAVPYAIAFYAGLRRAEIDRLEWPEVLDGKRVGSRLLVTRAKSEAGRERRPPIAEPLRGILREAWLRQGRPTSGRVPRASAVSRKLATRATAAWSEAGLRRITLHECRHTYASLLMAAGYTIKELMEFIGHADLQMVNR